MQGWWWCRFLSDDIEWWVNMFAVWTLWMDKIAFFNNLEICLENVQVLGYNVIKSIEAKLYAFHSQWVICIEFFQFS